MMKTLIKSKEKIFYEVSMSDRFGNYAVIALIGIRNNINFEVTDFLESCRVFKRNVEDYLIKYILNNKRFKNKDGLIYINRNKKYVCSRPI